MMDRTEQELRAEIADLKKRVEKLERANPEWNRDREQAGKD